MEETKEPYVPLEVLEYLEKVFGIDQLMTARVSNNDEHIGYIKGVRDVIGNLRNIHETALDKEV